MKQSVIGKARSIYSKSISSTMPGRRASLIGSDRPRRTTERRSRPTPPRDLSGPHRSSRLGQLDFQDQHVPLGQIGELRSHNEQVAAADGSDRLAVERRARRSLRPGPSAATRSVDLVQARAAEPASQDEPPRVCRNPTGPAGPAVGPRIRATRPLDMSQPPRSRIRCSVTMPSPPARPDESHTLPSRRRSPHGRGRKTARVIASSFMAALVWSSRT